MPVTQATPFHCPTCGADYKLVRVETKELVPDQQISCRKCGGAKPGDLPVEQPTKFEAMADVGVGSIHDRLHSVAVPINVRCYSDSDIIVRCTEVTLKARSGLMRGNKCDRYSMTSSAAASSPGPIDRPSVFALLRLITMK
jgi:hypothetical protein